MTTIKCTRNLTIFTHGETNSSNSNGSIVVRFKESAYCDGDCSELVPEMHKPFEDGGAGYWAIVRAIARAPTFANLAIKSDNEVCISTLKLLIDKEKNRDYYGATNHSHPDLLYRIMEEVKSRQKDGCQVGFEYIHERKEDFLSICEVRQIAQDVLKDVASKTASSTTDASAPLDQLSSAASTSTLDS